MALISGLRQDPDIIVLGELRDMNMIQTALTAADDGYVKARGRPTGAGLFVDGKYIGPAGRFSVPEKYKVAAGEHEIALLGWTLLVDPDRLMSRVLNEPSTGREIYPHIYGPVNRDAIVSAAIRRINHR